MAPPPSIDLAPYVEGHREIALERDRAARARREALRGRLPGVVHRLVNEYGVRRVVLFGSLSRGDAGPESDVDLLVEGLPPARFFEAVAMASGELGADVDLVPMETAHPGVAARALVEGEILHGRAR